MNNSKRLITASAVALVLSGGCTAVLSWTVSRNAVSAQEQRKHYAAPARPISAGKTLVAADLQQIEWPASSPAEGALPHLEDAIGRTALYPLVPGQPLLERDLSARGAGSGLAGRIPTGMRAIALRSDEVVGVAGFLSPGLHVDMLVTFHSQGTSEPVTASTLQDVEVIAVGQQSEPDPQGKPTTATVVTLLLTPEQTQRALLASTQGTLHFVLRNSADKGATKTAPVTLADLGSGIARTAAPMSFLPAATGPVKKQASPKPARVVPAQPAAVETILNATASSADRKGQ